MDFIFTEICLGALEKRKPAYAPYIQLLINAKCGEEIMDNYAICRPRCFAPSFIYGPDIPEFVKGKGPSMTPGASSSGGSQQQSTSGLAKFFKALFHTCSDTRTLAHDAMEMAKETRRIQNAERRAAGTLTEEDPPSLAAKVLVPIYMISLSDGDFVFNNDGQDDDAEDDEDEDEDKDEDATDDDALA